MKNYVSLCAIVRDEELYIREWIQYHYSLGIEQFYIYNNESKDNTYSLVQSLSDSYPIELMNVVGSPAQLQTYEHCLQQHRKDSRWIGFIDADEFIVPVRPFKKWLTMYEQHAGVAMHWYLFGSNGHEHYTPDAVVERFTRRQPDVNPHIKCFVNPLKTKNALTPHRFTHNGFLVDEHMKPFDNDQVLQYNGTADMIQINHYATKSKRECEKRRQTARADTGEVRNIEEFFKCHDRNEVEDLKAKFIWDGIHVF